MKHATLPPLAPPNRDRPVDAAPRGPGALWRQAARQAPTTSADELDASTTSRSPTAFSSQSSIPSLPSVSRTTPASPQHRLHYSRKVTTSSRTGANAPQSVRAASAALTALLAEEYCTRITIHTAEGLNRITFNLVKSRSTIVVLEEPDERLRIESLFRFGSCQIRLTQIIKIQAWWRLLLRHRKSWRAYAHGALRVWCRRSSDASRVSSSEVAQSHGPSRRQSCTSYNAPMPKATNVEVSALVRLEMAATSPRRYNIMMDEYIYSLRERADILLLLERRRSAERHRMLYYQYVDKCQRGIPEENLAWQERFVAEMFVAIVHFKYLPWGWRTRYKLPYAAWRALRWRTPRIAAPTIDSTAEHARRQQRQHNLAAVNDMNSLHDHQRLQLIGQEHQERQALLTAFRAGASTIPAPQPPAAGAVDKPVSGRQPRAGAPDTTSSKAPAPLDIKALTPLPPTRPPSERTLPPLNSTSSTARPQTSQISKARAHRSVLPPPRDRPMWATVPRSGTPPHRTAPATELDLLIGRLRQEEKDARTVVENQEYDERYRARWLYGNTRPNAAP